MQGSGVKNKITRTLFSNGENSRLTLPETNSSHLKMGRAPKERSIPTIHFQVRAVSFREGSKKIADEKLNTLVKNEKPSQLFVSQLEMKTQNWGETFYIRLKLKKKKGAVKRLSFHHEKPREYVSWDRICKK